jgi:hypothetical protein
MFALAKTVVKNLGLWYDNLENVVDTYIATWINMGFENDAIIKLSNYAFKSNIRTLDALNNNMNNMFKLGVLTSASVDNYLEDIVKIDNVIAKILSDLGIERGVISSDRTIYKVWLYDWKITPEILDYAISIAKGKYSAMQYLNRILSEYHMVEIKDLESAKAYKLSFVNAGNKESKSTPKSAKKREYTKKELDSLFDDITEIEI